MQYFASLVLITAVSAQMDMKAMVAELSPQCQAAAAALITSDFGSCADLMGLVNLLGAKGSLLGPTTAWLDRVCSTAPCPASSAAAAATTIQTGCQEEIKKGVVTAVQLSTIVSRYPTIRDGLCLEYRSNHTRCAPALMAAVEKTAGHPLTLMELGGFLTFGVDSLAPVFAKAPKETFCNDCTHALFTTLSPNSSSTPAAANGTTAGNSPKALVAGACGASFVDGKIPDTVSVPLNTSSSFTGGKGPNSPPGDAKNSANSIAISGSVLGAVFIAAVAFSSF